MPIIMTSPAALLRAGALDAPLVQLLKHVRAAGHPVQLVSNHPQPGWFAGAFQGSEVQFVRRFGRQSGEVVRENAERNGVKPHDVIVLATKRDDVQMGKNGGALLVAAGWSSDDHARALGIHVADASQLGEVINLTASWNGHWWYSGKAPRYHVRALSDLSGFGKTVTQQQFAHRLTGTVKNGGARLTALLAITARSLLMDGAGTAADLLWGVYPSSQSSNDDSDTLCDFTHRLRTSVSRVKFTERGVPLFVRHTPGAKRSAGGGGDRTDPTGQIATIHLNPAYRNRLSKRHVIVVDDCTTYGVSFGVAAAFLLKAGAASVTGVALGKFGNQLRNYEIDILTDPFQPVATNGFRATSSGGMGGFTNDVTQSALRALMP